jgi:hypothetical protein
MNCRFAKGIGVVVTNLVVALVGVSDVLAQEPEGDARAQCFEAHTAVQELRRDGKLLEAREKVSACSASECPGAIINDCVDFMTELDKTTPSMVFEVKLDGQSADDAQVYVDDVLVQDLVSGYQVNPGRYTIRVVLAPFEPMIRTVTLPAGQRMRLVSFEFQSASKASAPTSRALEPVVEVSRPTPVAVYPLLGLGVAGLASFGVMSTLGNNEQDELEDTCSPNCTDDELSKMKTMYLIGDISAGVGAAALLTAGIVYLARPTTQETIPPVSLTINPSGGAGIVAGGRF